jgi:amino acid transporter
VSLASGSAIFIWIAFVMFFSWFIMLAPNAPLGATRVMLAMSFDRVLPDWFGRVNPRTHTPIVGSKVYRRRKENFDISVVYRELPVE